MADACFDERERRALTIPQVAEQLACPISRVRKLIDGDKLRVVKLGSTVRTWRVEQDELDDFIRRGGCQ